MLTTDVSVVALMRRNMRLRTDLGVSDGGAFVDHDAAIRFEKLDQRTR